MCAPPPPPHYLLSNEEPLLEMLNSENIVSSGKINIVYICYSLATSFPDMKYIFTIFSPFVQKSLEQSVSVTTLKDDQVQGEDNIKQVESAKVYEANKEQLAKDEANVSLVLVYSISNPSSFICKL